MLKEAAHQALLVRHPQANISWRSTPSTAQGEGAIPPSFARDPVYSNTVSVLIFGDWQFSLSSSWRQACHTSLFNLLRPWGDCLLQDSIFTESYSQITKGAVIMQWGRSYMTCQNQECHNWIWRDKMRPGTRCRKCGQWWDHYATTGKGKGQGHGQAKPLGHGKAWPKKSPGTQMLDSPPGLHRPRPLKQNKEQAAAAELLATTWEVIPEGIQTKLMALGFGPPPPEEPELTELLKTHMTALPQEVQAVVTKLTQPLPDTEKDLAQKLKAQVGDLKSVSIKKTQLQTKLDQVKTQYASMLQDMQELQGKLNEGQKRLKQLSDQYMKITTS